MPPGTPAGRSRFDEAHSLSAEEIVCRAEILNFVKPSELHFPPAAFVADRTDF